MKPLNHTEKQCAHYGTPHERVAQACPVEERYTGMGLFPGLRDAQMALRGRLPPGLLLCPVCGRTNYPAVLEGWVPTEDSMGGMKLLRVWLDTSRRGPGRPFAIVIGTVSRLFDVPFVPVHAYAIKGHDSYQHRQYESGAHLLTPEQARDAADLYIATEVLAGRMVLA